MNLQNYQHERGKTPTEDCKALKEAACYIFFGAISVVWMELSISVQDICFMQARGLLYTILNNFDELSIWSKKLMPPKKSREILFRLRFHASLGNFTGHTACQSRAAR